MEKNLTNTSINVFSDKGLRFCYSDKYFVNSSPGNQHFICEMKKRSVQNFRIYTLHDIFVAGLNERAGESGGCRQTSSNG